MEDFYLQIHRQTRYFMIGQKSLRFIVTVRSTLVVGLRAYPIKARYYTLEGQIT